MSRNTRQSAAPRGDPGVVGEMGGGGQIGRPCLFQVSGTTGEMLRPERAQSCLLPRIWTCGGWMDVQLGS